MFLLVAVVVAAPQYEKAEVSGPRINRDQWAALNPYGYGSGGVPDDIQRQWESFLVCNENKFIMLSNLSLKT